MDGGAEFDGVRIGRPAVGGLTGAGFGRLEELPEELVKLRAIHGVGPKAIRLLTDERSVRREMSRSAPSLPSPEDR